MIKAELYSWFCRFMYHLPAATAGETMMRHVMISIYLLRTRATQDSPTSVYVAELAAQELKFFGKSQL